MVVGEAAAAAAAAVVDEVAVAEAVAVAVAEGDPQPPGAEKGTAVLLQAQVAVESVTAAALPLATVSVVSSAVEAASE